MIDSDHLFSSRRLLSLILAILLSTWSLPAQDKIKPSDSHSAGLKIYVLEGNGAVNFIPDGNGTTPVVEIRDSNELPVNGATVEFRLPDTGPTGEFPNGQHVFSSVTNVSGQVQAPFKIGPQAGSFRIQVNAKMDTRTASTVILQKNSMKASESSITTTQTHHWYKSWKVLALAGAGVAVVIVVILVTRGSSSNTPPVVGITPGNPTYGAPH